MTDNNNNPGESIEQELMSSDNSNRIISDTNVFSGDEKLADEKLANTNH